MRYWRPAGGGPGIAVTSDSESLEHVGFEEIPEDPEGGILVEMGLN